jgi:hypothetical protein
MPARVWNGPPGPVPGTGAEGALMTRQAKTALEYMARRKGSGNGDQR